MKGSNKKTVFITGKSNGNGAQLVVAGGATVGTVDINNYSGLAALGNSTNILTSGITPPVTNIRNSSNMLQQPTSTLILTTNPATGSTLQQPPASGTQLVGGGGTLPNNTIVLPNMTTPTIVLTNNTTGLSSILTLQQYQNLLQQYPQYQGRTVNNTGPSTSVPVQRNGPQPTQISGNGNVTVPLGNFITTANVAPNTMATSITNPVNSNIVLNNGVNTTSGMINGYQQQFQRHLLSTNPTQAQTQPQQQMVTVLNVTNNSSQPPNPLIPNQLIIPSTTAVGGLISSSVAAGIGTGLVSGIVDNNVNPKPGSYVVMNHQVTNQTNMRSIKRVATSSLQSMKGQLLNGNSKGSIVTPKIVLNTIRTDKNIGAKNEAIGNAGEVVPATPITLVTTTPSSIVSLKPISATQLTITPTTTASIKAITPLGAQQQKQHLHTIMAASATNQQRGTTIVLGGKVHLAATDIRKAMLTTAPVSSSGNSTMPKAIISVAQPASSTSKVNNVQISKSFNTIISGKVPLTSKATTKTTKSGVQETAVTLAPAMMSIKSVRNTTISLHTEKQINAEPKAILCSEGLLEKLQQNTATYNGLTLPSTSASMPLLSSGTIPSNMQTIISNGHNVVGIRNAASSTSQKCQLPKLTPVNAAAVTILASQVNNPKWKSKSIVIQNTAEHQASLGTISNKKKLVSSSLRLPNGFIKEVESENTDIEKEVEDVEETEMPAKRTKFTPIVNTKETSWTTDRSINFGASIQSVSSRCESAEEDIVENGLTTSEDTGTITSRSTISKSSLEDNASIFSNSEDIDEADSDFVVEPSIPAGADDGFQEVDIVINNVVCSFSVRCHLNLREIALKGANVEYRRENGMVTMKLRNPNTTASIWSSGRITCTGSTSESQAKKSARRFARCLQKLGFPVRFHNFRVVNVLGTCSMPFGIKIVSFSERYKHSACYEPELHPGVTFKLDKPKATLKIFSTGSITITAGSVADVQNAVEHIYALVYEFRKPRTAADKYRMHSKHHRRGGKVTEVTKSKIKDLQSSSPSESDSFTSEFLTEYPDKYVLKEKCVLGNNPIEIDDEEDDLGDDGLSMIPNSIIKLKGSKGGAQEEKQSMFDAIGNDLMNRQLLNVYGPA